jgi:hypothetical protein
MRKYLGQEGREDLSLLEFLPIHLLEEGVVFHLIHAVCS